MTEPPCNYTVTPWKTRFVSAIKRPTAWIRIGRRRAHGGRNESAALECRLLADIGLTRRRVECIGRHDRLPKRWFYDDCQ